MIKKGLIVLGIIICVGTVGVGLYKLPFIMGHWGNKVDLEIGTESKNVQREKFKNNKTYIESKAADIARYKREYERADNENDKKIIITNIQDEFSDFDESKLENDNLRQFLNDAMNNELN